MTKDLLWSSDGGFLKVHKAPVGKYFYSERKGVDSVAFILFDKETKKFGLTNEQKPPLFKRFDNNEMFVVTAFGGSIDTLSESEYMEKQSYDQILVGQGVVIREVKEEAGFTVNPLNVTYMGTYMVSTQSNQLCHTYIVGVNGSEVGDRIPQTKMEATAKTKWISLDDVHNGAYCNADHMIFDWKAEVMMYNYAKFVGLN